MTKRRSKTAITERAHQGEDMNTMTCREALQLLLDQVDFERGACSLTDMVGQCIPAGVLAKCRGAVAAEVAGPPSTAGGKR